MVTRLNTLLCQVSDMDRAVSFYRRLLGRDPGVHSPYWRDCDPDGNAIQAIQMGLRAAQLTDL